MTIVVTSQNGATVQFPDGTDSGTIKGVMDQHFGGDTPVPAEPVTTNKVVRAAATGVPIIGGLLNKADAATNAALAPILNPLFDEKDQLSEPTFGERYAHSLRDQEGGDEKFHTDHPVIDTAAKLTGGAAAMGPLVAAAPGVLGATGSLAARTLNGGVSNAVIGGADAAARGENPITGALIGGTVGAVLPGATSLITHAALNNPVVANIAAKMDPKRAAWGQVARGVHDSGMTGAEIEGGVRQAADEGQDVFTVGDAMGNAGQRLLSTVARAPGQGRTDVVASLDSRQGDQGRRLAGALREGFDAPQTAEQTRAAMADRASREADFNYRPVKSDTTAIDVSNPVSIANRGISPAADRLASAPGQEIVPPPVPTDPVARARAILNPPAPTYRNVPPALPTDLAARAPIEAQESVIADPIRTALKQARSYLAAPTLTSSNVHMAFRAKTNIDQMIATATEKGQGAMVRELMPIRDSLDEALANTSSNYAGARDAYRVAQQRLNALDLGKEVGSKLGSPEDAIRQFGALPDAESQQAFRTGYADPQVTQVQNGAFGTNKSRPFTTDATQAEFNVFAAPGRAEQLQRQIGRENTMFETRQTALGGSKTADNLADQHALGVDPHLVGAVGHIMSGNIGGAVRGVGRLVANGWTGNTPEVRQEVAKILLQRAPQMQPGALEQMVNQTVARLQKVKDISQALSRGASGAALPVVNQK
jgi:hypothetical protein